jgi:hypothetical protein
MTFVVPQIFWAEAQFGLGRVNDHVAHEALIDASENKEDHHRYGEEPEGGDRKVQHGVVVALEQLLEGHEGTSRVIGSLPVQDPAPEHVDVPHGEDRQPVQKRAAGARPCQEEQVERAPDRDGQKEIDEKTIRELLLSWNQPDFLFESHRLHIKIIPRIGHGTQYLGVNWLKGWYERNLIIYTNLTRITTSPDDRILVIYGAAHIPLLSQFIQDSGLYTLDSVENYL